MIEKTSNQRLTNAKSSQNSNGFIWWFTLRKERLACIRRKGQGNNGNGARPDNKALCPQPDKAHKASKSVQNVGIVATSFSDHASQLGVANCTDH